MRGLRNQQSRPPAAGPLGGRSGPRRPSRRRAARPGRRRASAREAPRGAARGPRAHILTPGGCVFRAATIPSTLEWASAGSIAGATCSKACAAILAVSRARGSGLVNNTSGRRVTRASPRAATRNLALPWGVRGRSASGTPGVPLGTAVAWRMSRSFIARTLSAPSDPTASGPPGHSDLRKCARHRSHRRTPRRPRRRC